MSCHIVSVVHREEILLKILRCFYFVVPIFEDRIRQPIPPIFHVGRVVITSYGLAASLRTVLQGAQFEPSSIGQPDLKSNIKSALLDYLCWHNPTFMTSQSTSAYGVR